MVDDLRATANPSIVFREEFDDWAILFDPESGDAFGVNPVSAFIWKRLDGRHTQAQIVDEVQSSFDQVPEDVPGHVREFIASLVERGFAGYEARAEG
jgi:SynChlorMet cassette protein ScmD